MRCPAASAALLLLALTAPSGAAGGDAAHLFAYYPKPGQAADFDEGYRRHLEWHREKKDPLVWYGWYVMHGDRLGLFIDGTFGNPFGALDERVDPRGDRADAVANVAPHADPELRSVYALRRDLSTGFPLEERRPSASLQVFHYRVRTGTESRFERAVAAARQALSRAEDAPEHTWYELVVGGEGAGYMLMVARAGWADYDRFRRPLAELAADGRDAAEAAGLRQDLAASVAGVVSETWGYRPDLSYFPEP